MNRLLTPLYPLTLALVSAGLAAAAFNAARHHPVALAMALLIAAGFALGVAELRAFRSATQGLSSALAALTQPATPAWLQTVPVALRTAVEQRLAGQRVALPGLALAPALAGVLVLLGMLGTFIGLVLTLGGTADAVSNTADLSALRAALGAPVRGLGLAFSASVAGVTASATLGLLLALARRERAEASRTLDLAQLGPLRPLTAEFQREQAQAAAEQAAREASAAQQRALVEQFQAFSQQLATTVTEQLAGQQARWEGRQHEAQQRFHTDALSAYQGLASSVDTTLRASLHEAMNASQQHASDTLQPLAEGLLSRIGDATQALQDQLGQQLGNWAAQQSETLQASSHRLAAEQAAQASALRSQFEQGAQQLLDHTRQAQATLLAETREAEAALLQQTRQAEAAQQANSATQSRALLQALHDQQHSLQQAHAEADRERLAAWAQARPEVRRVLHPAVAGSPGHEHWAKLCTAAAGLVTLEMTPSIPPSKVDAFVDSLRRFRIGWSWGGPVSLAVPYRVNGLRKLPQPYEGVLVRLCIGLEATEDLIADLEVGLSALAA